jgi:N6-adenosine-specific RNA methylase IME4
MKPFHKLAELFPLIEGEEFEELKKDIAENGLLDPIILHPDGSIVDGRNRYRACLAVGVTPRYETWSGTGSLLAFVISKNIRRRQLTASQRAALAVEILPVWEAEAKERQLAAGVHGAQGGRGKKKNPCDNFTTRVFSELTPEQEPKQEPEPEKTKKQPEPKSRDVVASMVGVSPSYVQQAKEIAQKAPELFEKIKKDEKVTIQEAKREIKESKRETVREQNRALVEQTKPVSVIAPNTTYQTIALDPPWDWGDEGDADQFGRARPTYATMSIDQIAALPVASLAAKDAHIYLWITNRSLPKGFALLESWGFRYITCLTWCKPSIGMGNYYRGSTEHILFGVRGSLPLLRRDMGTWFSASRPDRHSAKPEDFYRMVEACSPGPWLEMFARSQRNGWVQWGAEVSL